MANDYCPCGCGNIIPVIAREHEGVMFNGVHCIRRYLNQEKEGPKDQCLVAK